MVEVQTNCRSKEERIEFKNTTCKSLQSSVFRKLISSLRLL